MPHNKDEKMVADTKDFSNGIERATTPPDMAFEPIDNASDAMDDTKMPRFDPGGTDENPVEAEREDNRVRQSG
jgi:hypothetical protein